MINHENYIVYFVDFAENNLSEKERQAVLDFLDAHPEKKIEFQDFIEASSLTIHDTEATSFDAINLFHSEKDESEFLSIAYLEGDLDPTEALAFEEQLKHNEALSLQFNLLKQTYLKAPADSFEKKEALLQKAPSYLWLFVSTAAAAVIFLFFTLRPFITGQTTLSSATSLSASLNEAHHTIPVEKEKTTPAKTTLPEQTEKSPITPSKCSKNNASSPRENPETCCKKIQARSITEIPLSHEPSLAFRNESIDFQIEKPKSPPTKQEASNPKTLTAFFIDKINRSPQKKVKIDYDSKHKKIKSLNIQTKFLSFNKHF